MLAEHSRQASISEAIVGAPGWGLLFYAWRLLILHEKSANDEGTLEDDKGLRLLPYAKISIRELTSLAKGDLLIEQRDWCCLLQGIALMFTGAPYQAVLRFQDVIAGTISHVLHQFFVFINFT